MSQPQTRKWLGRSRAALTSPTAPRAADWFHFNDGHWLGLQWPRPTVLYQLLMRKTTARPRWLSSSHFLSGSRQQLRVRPPGGPCESSLIFSTWVSKLLDPPQWVRASSLPNLHDHTQDTPHPIGLLWKSDRSVAETST